MRSDETLSRQSFRFSSEWKRTGGAGTLTPEIDSRLAGVEQRGDKLVVHSLSGNERNHYFANRGGRAFSDLSALSGLDNPADSRGWALLDYDRDGWQDIALVNANQPLFNLYHNEIPASGSSPRTGMIAIRFVGGNKSSAPSPAYTSRDGYGAKVTAALGDMTIIREHRCGDGFAAQHSATMIIGIGSHTTVPNVSVRWPSGKKAVTENVPEGALLTVYENPADAPAGEAFARGNYRVAIPSRRPAAADRQVSPFAAADAASRAGTRLRVYTSMATWCPSCARHLPIQKRITEEMAAEPVELIAVPIDEKDDAAKLQSYVDERHPPYRLLATLPAGRRAAFLAELAALLGHEPALPSSLVTDASGNILQALPGLPTVSQLRHWLADGK